MIAQPHGFCQDRQVTSYKKIRKECSILDALSCYDQQVLSRHLKKVSLREVDHFTIIPKKLIQGILSYKDLTVKHVFVACELAKMCWAQNKYCSLEALLTKKPLASRLVYLNYFRLQRLFNLSKDQLKSILRRLEAHKLIRRTEFNQKWYVHIDDKLANLFFSDEVQEQVKEIKRNNKKFNVIKRKALINKGNIILHDWFKLIRNDIGHTCFNSILLIAEIIYYSRYFEIQTVEGEIKVVSKSRGVVPFFSFKDFQNRFNLSYAQVKSAIDLLVKRNLVSLDVVRTKYNRKVHKKTFFTANFEKLALESKLEFKFKTPRQLNKDYLSIFLNFHTPYTYARKYSISYTNIWLNNRLKNCFEAKKVRYTFKSKKFKQFKALDQIPRSYLDDFDYLKHQFSRSFLEYLLNKLANKYPTLTFSSRKHFNRYFKNILDQETSTKTGSQYYYFAKPVSIKKLANSRVLKNKLKSLIEKDKQKQIIHILAKLAKKDLKCTFNTLESALHYLQKALEHEKTTNQVKRIFDSLPKTKFQQVEKYLDSVESIKHTNYGKHPTLMEKFRARLAAKLPRRTAYYFLTSAKMFKIQTEGDRFIVPTLNKEYCDMLPRYIKQTIIEELQTTYNNQNQYLYESNQIRNLKFVHVHASEF